MTELLGRNFSGVAVAAYSGDDLPAAEIAELYKRCYFPSARASNDPHRWDYVEFRRRVRERKLLIVQLDFETGGQVVCGLEQLQDEGMEFIGNITFMRSLGEPLRLSDWYAVIAALSTAGMVGAGERGGGAIRLYGRSRQWCKLLTLLGIEHEHLRDDQGNEVGLQVWRAAIEPVEAKKWSVH